MPRDFDIQAIDKPDPYDPYSPIRNLQFVDSQGKIYIKPQDTVIQMIWEGQRFFVGPVLGRSQVIVKTSPYGNMYLTTSADSRLENNLLELPQIWSKGLLDQ